MDIFYPLEAFADWFVFSVAKIEEGSKLGNGLHFFVYDVFKILLLMVVITHLMGIINHYLPIEKIRDFLTKKKLYGLDYFFASIFGAMTPFCSCSSIPLFVGFLGAGIPLGVTFAFLITSPLINEVAITLFAIAFGWQFTLLYIACGVLIGMVGGFLLQKMKMEKYVEKFVWNIPQNVNQKNVETETKSWKKVGQEISKDAFGLIKKIAPYIIAGVAVGAFIHGYVPQDFFEEYLQKVGIWQVPLATILAIPMYANASGVIPIIQSLVAKGVSVGTSVAFMMAIVGLPLPEAMILKKVLKWQLLAAFFGVVAVGIIAIGYLFNFIF